MPTCSTAELESAPRAEVEMSSRGAPLAVIQSYARATWGTLMPPPNKALLCFLCNHQAPSKGEGRTQGDVQRGPAQQRGEMGGPGQRCRSGGGEESHELLPKRMQGRRAWVWVGPPQRPRQESPRRHMEPTVLLATACPK